MSVSINSAVVASVGGILVVAGLGAVSLILGRRLVETRVKWTPMVRRYAVVAVALAGWAVVTVPAWLTDPLSRPHLLGAPVVVPLLLVGVVVVGTLYHIVPFIIWVNRYSDRLGLEPVPMIDDLYSARLAVADLSLLLGGVVALLLGSLGGVNWLGLLGALALLAGSAVFVTNLLLVLHTHSKDSLSKNPSWAVTLIPVGRSY